MPSTREMFFVIFDIFKRKKKTATSAPATAKEPQPATREVAAEPAGEAVAKPATKPATKSSAPAAEPVTVKPTPAKAPATAPAKAPAKAPGKPAPTASASVAELREQAKKLGITGVSRLTKAELQKAIAAKK